MHMWDHGKFANVKKERAGIRHTLLTWEFKIMASHTYAHMLTKKSICLQIQSSQHKERTEFLRQTTITQSSNPANNPHNTFKSDSKQSKGTNPAQTSPHRSKPVHTHTPKHKFGSILNKGSLFSFF